MLLIAKHAQEGPNTYIYIGDFSCSVVELASCIDLVHCLQTNCHQVTKKSLPLSANNSIIPQETKQQQHYSCKPPLRMI